MQKQLRLAQLSFGCHRGNNYLSGLSGLSQIFHQIIKIWNEIRKENRQENME